MNTPPENGVPATGLSGAGGSTAFDLEQVYDSEIAPLMTEIIAICQRVQMPMVASFCYRKGHNPDDPEGLDYCTTVLSRGDWQTPEIMEAVRTIRNGARGQARLLAVTITSPGSAEMRPRNECVSALTALYIAVDERVARDVNAKVMAYINKLESDLAHWKAVARYNQATSLPNTKLTGPEGPV